VKITSLKINKVINYSGIDFTILSIDPPEITLCKLSGDVSPIVINYFDLITNPSFQPSKHLTKNLEKDKQDYYSVLDNLSEKKRGKVSKRLQIIRPLVILERIKQGDLASNIEFIESYGHFINGRECLEKLTQEQLILNLAAHHSISKRSIHRYWANYRKVEVIQPSGGEEGLIPKGGEGYKHRKDNKTIQICHPKHPDSVLHVIRTRLDDRYILLIKNVIEQDFLNLHKKSKKQIINLINIRCHKENLEPLKEITLYKILERIPKQIIDRFRYGSKVSEKYQDISRGYANEEALYPLHLVEIDHTRLDIDVLDEKTGIVIGRPWVTLGIDVYTRMVWCMHLSFEPPSANKVRKAIEQGILFKKSKEMYGTSKEWEMFGIPKNIVLDNGSEFSNIEIKRVINEVLKSNVRYRPVATPRYGGTIERLFRTLNMGLIHQLEGTRKSNVPDLGEYNSEKNALLTLEDLNEILIRFIADIYHYEEHRGLPLESNTPIIRYYEGLKISGFPDFIEEDEIEEFKIDLLPKLLKPYTKEGIRINNVFYKRNDLSVLINKREVKYVVKYNIDDISYIYLKMPDSPEYVKVFASYPSSDVLAGINLFTYIQLTKNSREKGKAKRRKIISEQELLLAKATLQEVVQKKYKQGRKVRQVASRMKLDIDIKVDLPKSKETSALSYGQLLEKARQASQSQKND
jgi:putative transposase